MLDFAPDRVRKRQFWGVFSLICGRFQLKVHFFNTLVGSRKSVYRIVHDPGHSALSFRTVDAAPAITRYRALNKHAISWMMLSRDRPLEAHLWRTFDQSCAEAQPVF